jgi:hypothetical protein
VWVGGGVGIKVGEVVIVGEGVGINVGLWVGIRVGEFDGPGNGK